MKTLKKKPMTEQELIEARDRLHELEATITAATEEKLAIRNYITEQLYPKDKEEGSTTVTVGSTKVAIGVAYRYTITREDAEKLRTENPKIAADTLRWNPEIRVSEYRKNQEFMDQYVVTKPTPPTVTFK